MRFISCSKKYAVSTERLFLAFMILFLMASCDDYPQDTYNTLEEARNGTLLVGYAENPPWVMETEEGLAGIEVRLVTGFAESIDAEIEWVEKNEQALLEELEHHNLHLVIAGLTSDTPWKGRVGLSGPYLNYEQQQHVMAVPPGEHAFLFQLQEFLNRNEKEIKELLNDYTEY